MAANGNGNGFVAWWRCWWQFLAAASAALVGWGIAWATLDARVDAVCVESAQNRRQIEAIAPEIEDLSRDITELKTDVRWIRESLERDRQ